MQLFTTTHTTYTTAYSIYISLLNSCHLDQLKVPQLTINEVRNTTVDYQTQRNDHITIPLIAGYEVTRFGVPMIGQHVNTVRGSRVTISPAVPGAQYRITAWALSNVTRSATPAVVDATTGEASKLLHESCTVVTKACYVCIAANNECRTPQLRRRTIYRRKGAATKLKARSLASQAINSGHNPSSPNTICTSHKCATILDPLGHEPQCLYSLVVRYFSSKHNDSMSLMGW